MSAQCTIECITIWILFGKYFGFGSQHNTIDALVNLPEKTRNSQR